MSILVNKFFLPILRIKIEKYTKMGKKPQKFNYALLAKWKWRLGVGEESVWRDVVESKYGN